MTGAPAPDDTTPLRLEDAAEAMRARGFPVNLSMLRTEIRKGRLTPARVAGKFFVTPAQVRDLFTPCPAAPKAPASTSSREPAGKPSGSSETERLRLAQAATLAACQMLSSGSASTSCERRSGKAPAPPARNVIPLR